MSDAEQAAEAAVEQVKAPLPGIPDFLGDAARIENVGALLQTGQNKLSRLQQLMVFEGHEPTTPCPEAPVNAAAAEVELRKLGWTGEQIERALSAAKPSSTTYQERFDALKRGMQALMTENQDIRDELVAEAKRRRTAIEKEIEKAHRNA